MAEPSQTVAAASVDGLLTGEAVALSVKPASVLLRGAGTAIDAVAYVGALALSAWLVTSTAGGAVDPALLRALGVAGLVFFLLVVPMVVEVASHGRSLGKLAIGARIVRDDGGAIQLRHSFVRALMGVVEIYMTFGGLAALVGLLNDRAKRLGDLLAGTHSQLERVPAYTPPKWGVPAGLEQWALIVDVARMPDALGRRISQFLTNASGLTAASRQRTAAELATEAAAYAAPVPPVPAEVFLVAVTAVRRQRELTGLALEREHLDALQPILAGNPHRFPDR
ncbi:RDD family protein [Rathayibacter sp. YIM 133350]|uniref:RDD family protein n=1 Tax=Rathayibacter sp. YIM 133350 TaxID=3131992 RepID=UPI00307EDB9E